MSLLSSCWTGVRLSLEMGIDNILLEQMERAVSGKVNTRKVVFVLSLRVMQSIINSCVWWSNEAVLSKLENRFMQHCELEAMKTKFSRGLPTSTETSEREVTPRRLLESYWTILGIFQYFFEIPSQILLMFKISHLGDKKVLFAAILLRAIITRFYPPHLYKLPLLAYISNDAYKRAESLKSFAYGPRFNQDIISNNLGKWIAAEYGKASAELGDVSTDEPSSQYNRPLLALGASRLLEISPSMYLTILAVKYPRYLSLSSISTLQASGRSLIGTVSILCMQLASLREALNDLKTLYAPKIPDVMKDGTVSLTEREETNSEGMSIVLKDVSFAYSGGEKKTSVLSGVNLDIKAGQLIIIVGVNGSGKSTLTRLMARLYDPSSGELLIEGRPSADYRIADLREVTTLLSQDSQIYPLSLAENIGLGYPERSTDLEMIKEAASDGGAAEFIEGLENGYQTMLDSFDSAYHRNLNGDREHPLWVMSTKLKKQLDISGGQRQRIIAARAFMAFRSGRIKLVIVDEPTSALDADAEIQLFQRLMSVREGKTMVVVTHRFGHITRFADQIICMKDGTIVEKGRHEELMSEAGEYANLYKIQAEAFSDAALPDSRAEE